MRESASLSFNDIKLGAVYEFKQRISKDDVMSFAKLSGNYNPLHVHDDYGKQSKFGDIIVHGMLTASYFSALLGMYCPGKRGLCLGQTLQFKLPIYCDDEVIVRGRVIAKNETTKVITLKTEIIKNGKIAVDGEAMTILIGEDQ